MKPVQEMTIEELVVEYGNLEHEYFDANNQEQAEIYHRQQEVITEAKRRDYLVAHKQELIGV